MNQLWELTIDDYLEIVRRAQEAGLKPGDSMEQILFIYVKEKGIKSIGVTELNKEELVREYKSKGNNVLSIEKEEIK